MRLLDKREVAERLGMSVHTVMSHRAKGHPFFRDKAVKHLGHQLRWKDADLDAYIAGLDYDE